ncbi:MULTISPECIES: hypothetical protein [unclassified Acinetobacter]|uniref:hypothetical protein n=1 Tax=unclassified Acinetobacter TaxID=196816 RepID=UPI0035B7D7EF
MKKLMILASVLLMTGCISERDFQPPPKGYEVFQGYHVRNDEIIKQDMRACGFPDVNNEAEYFNTNKNEYVKSVMCMVQKGYKDPAVGKGICSVYSLKNTEACQNRQKHQ